MRLNSLKDVFLEELKDAYDFEKQIVKALPKMIKKSSSSQLQSAFEEHLEQTKNQVVRLEKIFDSMGQTAKASKCEGLRGIIDEGDDLMGEDAEPTVRDAGIIAAAQKVEHYEIATYGTLATWAQELGMQDAVRLLNETLEEEKTADKKLTEIAKRGINVGAAQRRAAA